MKGYCVFLISALPCVLVLLNFNVGEVLKIQVREVSPVLMHANKNVCKRNWIQPCVQKHQECFSAS